MNGRTGLFPTTYTEVVNSSSSSLVPKPVLPPRQPMSTPNSRSMSRRTSPSPLQEPSPEPVAPKHTPKWLTVQPTGESIADDDDHPFGDHFVASSRSPLHGSFYPESIASSGDEYEEEQKRLVPERGDDDDDAVHDHRATPKSGPPPLPVRRPSVPAAKRPPPPPPPPRRGSGMLQVPPIPSRPGGLSNTSSQSNSTNASFVSIAPPSPGLGHDGLTSSPFD